MEIIMDKILPINLMFLIGYILKKSSVLSKEAGGAILKLIFYAMVPFILYHSIRQVELSARILLYPLAAVLIHGLMYLVGAGIYKTFYSLTKDRAILISSLMIMNTGFILPFFMVFYKREDIWRVGVLDLGNAVMVFTVVYSLFLEKEKKKRKLKTKILFFLKNPPLVGIFMGILVNIFKLETPSTVVIISERFLDMLGPLIMIALGLYFEPKFKRKKLTVGISLIKFSFGYMLATLLTFISGIGGVDRAVLYLMACSPVGVNVLTFSILTGSDTEQASSIVSFSIILNLILTPMLLIYLRSPT